MDATLSYGLPRVNESGTCWKALRCGANSNPADAEAIIERALRYCDWAVAKGLLAIRSHVDTSDPSLLPVRPCWRSSSAWRRYLDLQLVAFPQDGVLRTRPGGLAQPQTRAGPGRGCGGRHSPL
jgi:cytosine deaminase